MKSTGESISCDWTQLGASELAQRIAAGTVSTAEVVDAYLSRIEAVNGSLRAVVTRLDDQARREADAADVRQRRGEQLGPLHGVPVTIKECFAVTGTDATMALSHLAGNPAKTDSPLVARLRAAGAIIVGKTNVPQLMLMHETDSPFYGRCLHPQDSARSPGGSSGGEAAILSAGGSALGLASDLGGSIRQPAHVCGITGLMPTTGRLTVTGCLLNYPGLQAIPLQPGPMARNVVDLDLAMRVLTTATIEVALPDEVPLPWRNATEVELAGVRVAIMEDDGVFTPSPAIRRAVRESAEVLRRQGLIVESFRPPGMSDLLELYVGLLGSDGMQGLKRLVAGEQVDWRMQRLINLGSIPNWLRPMLAAYLRLRHQPRLAHLVSISGRRSAEGYIQLVQRLQDFVARIHDAFREGNYAALVFPAHGLPALTHGASAYLLSAASYCFLPNLLGAPAGVVPFTQVGTDEQTDRPNLPDLTSQTAMSVERGSAGLPVGVQVAGLPWRDDVVLAIMQLLETAGRQHAEQSPCAADSATGSNS